MKKTVNHYLPFLFLLCLTVVGCTNDDPDGDPEITSNLNLLVASTSNDGTELTNIDLVDGIRNSFNIDCMVVSSRVYDKATQTIGYTDCNSTFRMINPTTGEELNAYALPGPVSMAVVNEAEHILIGTYYEQTTQQNHVIRMDLDDGTLLSDLVVSDLGPMYICTQFFDQGNQQFSLISSDNEIVTVDAVNGTVVSKVGIRAGSNIVYYMEDSKTLIAITYDQNSDTNYLEKSNAETGELLQRTALQNRSDFRLCAIGYDVDTNSLVTVNSQNQVRYINIDNGGVTDRVQLPQEMAPVTFWQ